MDRVIAVELSVSSNQLDTTVQNRFDNISRSHVEPLRRFANFLPAMLSLLYGFGSDQEPIDQLATCPGIPNEVRRGVFQRRSQNAVLDQ